MIDEKEAERIRARNAAAPGAIENFADFCSRQWRGLQRLFAGVPIGLVLAAGIVLAAVEAYMIAEGYSSMMAVEIAHFSGAVLVITFIWLVHELFVAIETHEPFWEQVGWGFVVAIVFAVVSFSFFVTQVNNATFDYDAAAQRNQERTLIQNRIAADELSLTITTVPTWYEADKAQLEAVQAAGKRWSIKSFDDCAPEGGFSRQAQVDICNRWGELRVRILEAEATIAERKRLEDAIAAAKAELESKPKLEGDAAWDAVAKLRDGDVSTTRSISLAILSAFMIWVTAFIWHKLITHFKRARGKRQETL